MHSNRVYLPHQNIACRRVDPDLVQALTAPGDRDVDDSKGLLDETTDRMASPTSRKSGTLSYSRRDHNIFRLLAAVG